MLECKKYPRTFHLPWSKGVTKDDKFAKELDHFIGKEVIITEKMDGENTSMYPDYGKMGLHARSINSLNEWWHEWCKNLQVSIVPEIEGYRLCGENMTAIHSIEYDNLQSYFYLFSIWDMETNTCLAWDDMMEIANALELVTPKVLYRGVWDAKLFEQIFEDMDKEKMEGYTIRVVDSFHYDDFSKSLVKAVRDGHVQTDVHWRKNAKQAKIANPDMIMPSSMRGKSFFKD